MEPVYITGSGIVSAIGVGKEATLAALQSGTTGIGKMKYLTSCHDDLPVGEVQLSNDEMMQLLGIGRDVRLTRTALMGRIALREALEEAQLLGKPLDGVHFISATTVGGMDRREEYHSQEKDCDSVVAAIATHHCGHSTQSIAEPFGPFASLSTVSTACSAATNAIITGANMLRCGLADIVVVGGSESLTRFHLNGFNALMILDHEQCKPFDINRNGLNLGEAAATVIYQKTDGENHDGWMAMNGAIRNDANHISGPSRTGEGSYRAMRAVLRDFDINKVGLVNVHGTSTPYNDEMEAIALSRMGLDKTPVNTLKGYYGHTMGAAGVLEAVLSMHALDGGIVLATRGYEQCGTSVPVNVSNEHRQSSTKAFVKLLSGFGGCNAAMLFKKGGTA